MALIINVKSVENLQGKSDRYIKLTFRDFVHQSKTVHNARRSAYFGEKFEWPIARAIDESEKILVQVFNKNSFVLSQKPIGKIEVSLQHLIKHGRIEINECLTDSNNKIIGTTIELELFYNSPDGATTDFDTSHFQYPNSDDLLDNKSDDFNSSIDTSITGGGGGTLDRMSTYGGQVTGEDTVSQTVIMDNMYKSKGERPNAFQEDLHKLRDFQICITIHEAQQLFGLDIDPVIRINIGDEKKYTNIKQSTNCPFYNEYFVFDFNESASTIFDKMITITAVHAYNIPGRSMLRATNRVSGKDIGQFKCDIGTVYTAPDHQFYRKWAVLLDPKDLGEGPKGYVKCDLAVISKGDTLKTQTPPKDEDNIETNLLLPAGVSLDRTRATYSLSIFRAEGIPKMDSGLVSALRKKLAIDNTAQVDAFVRVIFVGMEGKTKVVKSYNPIWKQKITFLDMFPPLANRIKIQLMDSDMTNDDVIATHSISLAQIMDPSAEGEGLPTMGPTWVNFYGAPRGNKMIEEHEDLNEGQGEGCAYRGRLLMALKMTLLDGQLSEPSSVFVSKMGSEAMGIGERRQFLVYATLFESSLIDPQFRDKDIEFELSIGCYGNLMDGGATAQSIGLMEKDEDLDADDETLKLIRASAKEEGNLPVHSMSKPFKAKVDGDGHYHIEFGRDKPCLYVVGMFEQVTRRLYMSNALDRIVDNLEEGLEDVTDMLKMQHEDVAKRLRGVCARLSSDCQLLLNNMHKVDLTVGSGSGKTKLDKVRSKMIRRHIERLCSVSEALQEQIKSDNVIMRIHELREVLRKLRNMVKDPQSSLPDVLLWMIVDKKRAAYFRFNARDLIAFPQSSDKGGFNAGGKLCAKPHTVFLRKPGKKNAGQSGWITQAALRTCLWLGAWDDQAAKAKPFLDGVPKGYDDEFMDENLPKYLHYLDEHVFTLRAYLFQARNLIGSDDTGLSDPFAKIMIGNKCSQSHIKPATLSPIWNECIEIKSIYFYGQLNDIQSSPPYVIVEIYDHDIVGKAEFLGKAMIRPSVKLMDADYDKPPELQWWDIYRGNNMGGEIMASFELLQNGDGLLSTSIPSLEMETHSSFKGNIQAFSIPPTIKPVLCKYRMETIFWGLRELKRVQLLAVESPQVFIECGGVVIESTKIEDINKNANFPNPLKFTIIELPENELFWPPITIRCIDHRNFGRTALVGTTTLTNTHKYVWKDVKEVRKLKNEALKNRIENKKRKEKEKKDKEKKEKGDKSDLNEDNKEKSGSIKDSKDVVIDMQPPLPPPYSGSSEKSKSTENLKGYGTLPGNLPAVIEPSHVTFQEPLPMGGGQPHDPLMVKAEDASRRKRRRELINDLDWWSKYYVTKEDLEQSEAEEESEVEDFESLMKQIASPLVSSTPDAIDFKTGFSAEAIARIRDQKSVNTEDEDDSDDGLNSKQRKKLLKKKKKKNKKKKKAVKKRAKHFFKGIVNAAFKRDDDDNLGDMASYKEPVEDKSFVSRIKIYKHELEREYQNFEQVLLTFPLYKGKKVNDDEDDSARISGKFKGNITLYKIEDEDVDIDISDVTKLKFATLLPSSKPINMLVRIYVVQVYDLHPVDLNGKADPYVVIKLGKKEINDKESKKCNTLSAVFGKMYEMEATFPMDSMLSVTIMDYDTLSADDLIGETTIDLENRLFSEHRACCGMSSQYEQFGYNVWRDSLKPTQILAKLCREHKIEAPDYFVDHARFLGKNYYAGSEIEMENGDLKGGIYELQAHEILKRWSEVDEYGVKLVEEHVETRPLYNRERPGVVQGKVEMWVDMFPKEIPPVHQVDITPRQPKGYELRCTIWNTDDVMLEDTNILTGEASSDIYVKGYILGIGCDDQCTDVHYRSLSGEGNFNWRFVFPFEYLKAEEKIVRKKKDSVFSMEETEEKIKARFTLQVWDADLVSADDFLGCATLDLNRMPRPTRDKKDCSLKQLTSKYPKFNLFKQKVSKGWWPMEAKDQTTGESLLVGKVEAELKLVTLEEAEKCPVGRGRDEPDPLPEPNRPDSSFLWFMNPLKTLKYIIWKNYKWLILKVFLILLLVAFIALFIYAAPGYTVKKIFGA